MEKREETLSKLYGRGGTVRLHGLFGGLWERRELALAALQPRLVHTLYPRFQ